MFKLDNAFLEELGLGSLPPVEKNKMLAHIYETLEMRVGMKLAEQMSNEQLDEFESYIKQKDEAGALKWLESNFPDYKQVVAQELEKLKSEIAQVAPQIVSQFAVDAGQAQQQFQQPGQMAPNNQKPMPQQNQPIQPPIQQQNVPTQNPQSQPMQQNSYTDNQQNPTFSAPQQQSAPPAQPQQQPSTSPQPQQQSNPAGYPDPSQSVQQQTPQQQQLNDQNQQPNYGQPVIPPKPWQPEN